MLKKFLKWIAIGVGAVLVVILVGKCMVFMDADLEQSSKRKIKMCKAERGIVRYDKFMRFEECITWNDKLGKPVWELPGQ